MTTVKSSHRRRSSRRRRGGGGPSRTRADTWWVVGFAGFGGALSGVEPTGWFVSDALLGALFAAAVALAASRARRWALVATAALTFSLAGGAVEWLVAAGLALAIAAWVVIREHRTSVWGAIVGGICAQVLLHLPDLGPQGTTAMLAVVAVIPLLLSGYRRCGNQDRRVVRRFVLGLSGVLLLATAAYGVAAVLAREALDEAVADARGALDLIRDGRTEEAGAQLATASDKFRRAEMLLGGPLAAPGRVVPVVGHHAQATAELSRSGADLTEVAARTTTTTAYGDLAVSAGQIDLTSVRSMRDPLEESLIALERAHDRLAVIDDRWLLPLVREPLGQLNEEVDAALAEATLAQWALEVSPAMLGASTPKTYLVLLGQPAESRFGGGFVGTWAELRADDGKVDLIDSGPIDVLRQAPGFRDRTLSGPRRFLERYGRFFPAYNLQNVTATPDLPTVRTVMTELYPQVGRGNLDGVLYLDPFGLAAFLELSGPVEVEGLGALTSANAGALLSTEIYELYPDSEEREDVLADVVEATFDALTSRDLPGPRTAGKALGPAVRAGQVGFTVNDEPGDAFLESIGTNGRFPRFEDGVDLLAVKTSNAAPNKIDSYLERSIHYDVRFDPETGDTEATLGVTLTNTAPPEGLPAVVGTNRGIVRGDPGAPPPGTAIVSMSIWSPLTMVAASAEGTAIPMEFQQEFLRNVYSTQWQLAPGESATRTFRLEGQLEAPYRLVVDSQPLVNQDRYEIEVSQPAGWLPGATEGFSHHSGALRAAGVLEEPRELIAEFEPIESR